MSAISLHQIQVCFGAKGKHFSIAVYNNSATEAGKKIKFGKIKSKQAISVYSKTFELSLSDILGQTLFYIGQVVMHTLRWILKKKIHLFGCT